MSLVAYDSSDEDSGNEDTESVKTIITDNEAVIDTTAIVNMHINKKLTLPVPKIIFEDTKKSIEENSNVQDLKNVLNMLPKPMNLDSAENIEEDNDVPPKKEIESDHTKQAKKRVVKITVPSLSEFKDLEEEQEKPPIQTVKPSEKGCGLFTLLIAPKQEFTKNKILIPYAVKNATVKANTIRKKSNTEQADNPKLKKSIVDSSNHELSSDEEDEEIDFFGLTTSKNTTDNLASKLQESMLPVKDIFKTSTETTLIKEKEDNANYNPPIINSANDQLTSQNKTLTSNVMNLPKEEILLKNKAEIGPKLPVPEQEYNVDTEGNVAFDEKAIEYLCGRRGVKRKNKEIDAANIIEINGEDIKPDEREWLVKALTEEPVHRPISMQSGGVNSQSKKKHQITYLAHQAKAMELELKNQWSQNRMTRKQTKSKYGF